MSNARDGMNFAPDFPKTEPVVRPGEFVFAAAFFDHGHIYGQIDGLAEAGGELKYVYDANPAKLANVLQKYPRCRAVASFDEILADPEVKLVTAAAIPCERCGIGLRVMEAGKDYFTDKSPFTTLDQLEQARAAVARTNRKYLVSFNERLFNEAALYAGSLIEQGAIGRVLQVLNLAPHNLNAASRPEWFFRKEAYGGILTDIGSHQFEQFLHYTGATDAKVEFARVGNLGHPEHPGLEDFGEALITTDTGASCYARVDWFNPKASRTWGDGRTFVLGTDGYIEIRKYIDVGRETGGDVLFLVNNDVEREIHCRGKVGFPFPGKLILDVLNRTELAMTQEHAFKTAEICMKAQALADASRARS